MTQKASSSSKEYQRAICATCPAAMACVAGAVRGVYRCYHCGKMWAMVYVQRVDRDKVTAPSLFRATQEIVILEAHYDVCPKRDRESEKKYGSAPTPNWTGVQCRACREAQNKQEMLEKRRR